MRNRVVALSLLIGAGLSLPALAEPLLGTASEVNVSAQAEARQLELTNSGIAQGQSTETISPFVDSVTKVENSFQLSASTRSQEYVFTGNANEVVIVYLEGKVGREYWIDTSLQSPSNQAVGRGSQYPNGINFAELEGRHRTFRLPETGEYRLTLTTDLLSDAELADAPLDYSLKVRLASYEERLLIHGSDLMDTGRYQDAISIFSQAIAYNPNIPFSYFGRAAAHAAVAAEAAEIDEESLDSLDDMYQLFQSLDLEVQTLVTADLRQLGRLFVDAIARDETTAEQIDIDPQIFIEVASFFETGEQSATLTEILETEDW